MDSSCCACGNEFVKKERNYNRLSLSVLGVSPRQIQSYKGGKFICYKCSSVYRKRKGSKSPKAKATPKLSIKLDISTENNLIIDEELVAKKAKLDPQIPVLFSDCPASCLETIRQMQDRFCKERNWDQYHTPRNVLLAMVGEVGEVAELFQWKGEVKEGLPDWSEKEKKNLSHELSDVLIYLVRLSDRCDIDLPAAVMEKFKLNAQKYPAKKVYGSNKKYNEYPVEEDNSSDKNQDETNEQKNMEESSVKKKADQKVDEELHTIDSDESAVETHKTHGKRNKSPRKKESRGLRQPIMRKYYTFSESSDSSSCQVVGSLTPINFQSNNDESSSPKLCEMSKEYADLSSDEISSLASKEEYQPKIHKEKNHSKISDDGTHSKKKKKYSKKFSKVKCGSRSSDNEDGLQSPEKERSKLNGLSNKVMADDNDEWNHPCATKNLQIVIEKCDKYIEDGILSPEKFVQRKTDDVIMKKVKK